MCYLSRFSQEESSDMKERKSPKQPDETEKVPLKKPVIKAKSKQNVNDTNKPNMNSDKYKLALIPITLVSALVFSWYYNNYLSSLVNKPLDEPRIVDESSYTAPENLDRYWGSYR